MQTKTDDQLIERKWGEGNSIGRKAYELTEAAGLLHKALKRLSRLGVGLPESRMAEMEWITVAISKANELAKDLNEKADELLRAKKPRERRKIELETMETEQERHQKFIADNSMTDTVMLEHLRHVWEMLEYSLEHVNIHGITMAQQSQIYDRLGDASCDVEAIERAIEIRTGMWGEPDKPREPAAV